MGPTSTVSIVKAKKSLGQNFFTNKNLAEKIVNYVISDGIDQVIEIGPGRGLFTHLLSKHVPVYAIEKDYELVEILQSYFTNTNVKIINRDALEIEDDEISSIIQQGNTNIYGSLPYNISKRIIDKYLRYSSIKSHYYIIQKEVAEDYVARNGNNQLSLISGLFAESQILETIKPGNFRPIPKVTSSLIKFTSKNTDLCEEEIESCIDLIHLSFRKPRKKLNNNLKGSRFYESTPKHLLELRPSDLQLDDIIGIVRSSASISK